MAKYTRQQIKTLPQPVQDNYFDADLNDRYAEEIYPLLSVEEREKITDLILDVYFKAATPSAFLASLREIIKDDGRFQKIAITILGRDFFKLADYLNVDIRQLIIDNGGDPVRFLTRAPVREAVAQVRRKSAIALSDERVSHRLNKILESRLLNVRNDEQVLNLLTGSVKTSGIGLDEPTAKALLLLASEESKDLEKNAVALVPDEEFDAEQGRAKAAATAGPAAAPEPEPVAAREGQDIQEDTGIEEEEEEAEEISAMSDEEKSMAVAAIVAQPAAPAPETPKKDAFTTVTVEDEREIQQLQRKMSGAASPELTEAEKLTRAVDEAVAASGLTFADPDIKRRFTTAVSLFFRDLRDSLETKSKLTMPRGSGGMGLDDAEAERVMALLDARVSSYRGSIQSGSDAAKQQYLAMQSEKVMIASDQAQKKETEALDRRYSEITGGAVAAPANPALPPVQSVPKIIPVVDAAAPAEVRVPASSEPEAMNIELTSSASKAPPPAGLPVEKPVEPPAPPATPPQIQIPALTEAKPVVADVKFASKLLGPVEELRSMTLKDFRRLSRDPHEATLKITDKIDLLKEESFEKRTAGIKAWQESETNRYYLELLRASLEGRQMTDIISEKEAKGESVLNKAEFDAIMELNRKLRFG